MPQLEEDVDQYAGGGFVADQADGEQGNVMADRGHVAAGVAGRREPLSPLHQGVRDMMMVL